jgi:hypothetical protein
MSAHYLVDLYGNPLSTSRVIDVRDTPSDASLMNGTFVVRIPDGVPVDRPASLSALLTQKYTGLLAFYAGFTRIAFDDLLDVSAVSVAGSSKCLLGDRGSVALLPGGVLTSVAIPLTGSAASQAACSGRTSKCPPHPRTSPVG